MTVTHSSELSTSASIADRLQITETASNLGLLVDERAWEALQALFLDTVEVDYTSLNGGQPMTVPPSELIAGWRQNLDHLDATQHHIANHVVTINGDQATCSANVIGTHVMANPTGEPIWTVGGRYDIGLRRSAGRWRICALTLTVQWATGNQYIMTMAAAGKDTD